MFGIGPTDPNRLQNEGMQKFKPSGGTAIAPTGGGIWNPPQIKTPWSGEAPEEHMGATEQQQRAQSPFGDIFNQMRNRPDVINMMSPGKAYGMPAMPSQGQNPNFPGMQPGKRLAKGGMIGGNTGNPMGPMGPNSNIYQKLMMMFQNSNPQGFQRGMGQRNNLASRQPNGTIAY